MRIVEPEQGTFPSEHPAGRFDVTVREHPERHFHEVFRFGFFFGERLQGDGKTQDGLRVVLGMPFWSRLIGEVNEPRFGQGVDVPRDA